MDRTQWGAVAAGHADTAKAAQIILQEGGNAFDAVIAGMFVACVAEPVLTSLGGGGFLLARPIDGRPVLYDFFAQTPRRRRTAAETDFRSVHADFGTTLQEFHIGLGAMATPGMVKGLFAAHRDLGRMPMQRIVEPALFLARRGVRINALQASIFEVVRDIYLSGKESRALFGSRRRKGGVLCEGELFMNAHFGDFLESLAGEGETLFTKGDVAAHVAKDCAEGGGHLDRQDFSAFEVHRREPLTLRHGDAQLFTNPPPSTGGVLIAFGLELARATMLWREDFASAGHLVKLAHIMTLTNEARQESGMDSGHEADVHALLSPDRVVDYRARLSKAPKSSRGTTHISVIDGDGNAVAMTASNGEGAAYVIPGTGIMMNNMLGEADINPHGFGAWPEDTRMASMMAPTLALNDKEQVEFVLGSGGSNRIRTAILQVLLNVMDFRLAVDKAVEAPRIHVDADAVVHVEAGFDEPVIEALQRRFESVQQWPDRSIFFGGVHCVRFDRGHRQFSGYGDPRRGGVFRAPDGVT